MQSQSTHAEKLLLCARKQLCSESDKLYNVAKPEQQLNKRQVASSIQKDSLLFVSQSYDSVVGAIKQEATSLKVPPDL
jgi:hypothetical protein